MVHDSVAKVLVSIRDTDWAAEQPKENLKNIESIILREQIDYLLKCSKKLKGVEITSDSNYESVIDKHKDHFFLVEPPPFNVNKLNGGKIDHYHLSSVLRELEGDFLVVYPYSPEIQRVYDWCFCWDDKMLHELFFKDWKTKERYEGKELFVANYPIETVL